VKLWYNTLHQNCDDELTDDELVRQELYLLDQIEGLGFDGIAAPEHHFDSDYSASPDHFQIFAYMAGRTTTLELMLGAVILPWHDPLRVIERVALLDHISNGRVHLGFGRGLARMEYAGLRVDMEESRERFDEAAAMVLRGLREGAVENDGPFYPQPYVPIRPRPTRSFEGRIYSVGMSPDSALKAADLKATLVCFITKPIEDHIPMMLSYTERYEELHGEAPPPIFVSDMCYCHEDADVAAQRASDYSARYFRTVVSHYDYDGTHFEKTKAYASYAEGAKAIREYGVDASAQAFVDVQASIGTPEAIVEKYQQRAEAMSAVGLESQSLNTFKYGGMPLDVAEQSLQLFAKEVLPQVKAIGSNKVEVGAQ
jgi:alkanesulfonate monooxygenase SsuD/methylene tetrahydromethanopterin reductase-like flavin-dependent oxidoreductase (luciferase family)